MTTSIKHIGRIKDTGRKVLVAFRTLPGEADSALVIQTENLPDMQHDALIKLVESAAGQSSYEFAEVLGRARFSDGSTMLANLHVHGRLSKVRTSDVEMTPNLHTTISLDELNQLIASQRGLSVNDLALGNQIQEAASISNMPAATEIAAETEVAKIEQPLSDADLATKYRADAARLLAEAEHLKSMADQLVPEAKPKASTKPDTSATSTQKGVKQPDEKAKVVKAPDEKAKVVPATTIDESSEK